ALTANLQFRSTWVPAEQAESHGQCSLYGSYPVPPTWALCLDRGIGAVPCEQKCRRCRRWWAEPSKVEAV
ncbi:MAG: hypothetical protein AB7P49_05950, partial [Bdellovibrionales bacterium]